MKKFSIVVSILAFIAGAVALYFSVTEFLKRRGYFSDEEEENEDTFNCDYDADADEEMESEPEEEISFMDEEANEEAPAEEVPSEEEPKA